MQTDSDAHWSDILPALHAIDSVPLGRQGSLTTTPAITTTFAAAQNNTAGPLHHLNRMCHTGRTYTVYGLPPEAPFAALRIRHPLASINRTYQAQPGLKATSWIRHENTKQQTVGNTDTRKLAATEALN